MSVVFFTSCGYPTGWGSFSVFRQLRESICRVGYRVAWALEWVTLWEFHLLVVPMGWNWRVWFVQQMLEHLLLDEAGETTLRHLSPTPLWDVSPALALSQAEADESLACMLRRLETAGVVASAKPSSDALLGVELVESGTCWRPSPMKFWRTALALRELAFGKCRRTTQFSRALGHAMSLFGLRRELYSFPVFIPICDSHWRTCGPLWSGKFALLGRCSLLQGFSLETVGYNCSCGRRVSFLDGSCGSHCAVHRGQECGFNFGALAIQGTTACHLETA